MVKIINPNEILVDKNNASELLIGMSLDDATIKFPRTHFCVGNQDGVPIVGTWDFQSNRVNIKIVNNVITDIINWG